MIRFVLLFVGAALISLSFSHSVNAARTVPTSRQVQVAIGDKYSLRVTRDAFAPLVQQLPAPGTAAATTQQGLLAQQGAQVNGVNPGASLGTETLLLCNTIEPPNPVAVFLLGSDRIYATVGTPISAALHVQSIQLGSVTFNDGSTIAQTDCSGTLPSPDLHLTNGTANSQTSQSIVPAPPTATPQVAITPGSAGVQPIVTPTPIYNPYSGPMNSSPPPNSPYMIITRPTP